MRTALRSSRVRKWLAFVLFVTMLAGWVASFQYSVRYQSPKANFVIVFDGGGVLIARYMFPRWHARDTGWQVGLAAEMQEGRSWFIPKRTNPASGTTWLFIPLLPVILLVVGVMCWWFWRDHPPPPTHCRFCGYDMKGNVSGVCPECGTAKKTVASSTDVRVEHDLPRNEEGDDTR